MNSGDTVLILHGILRSSRHMRPLAAHLQQQGYRVVSMDYPSTRQPIDALAEGLQPQIRALAESSERIHYIGYSMGGLLVRVLLHQYRPANLGRVVQLASPNHGSEVADFLRKVWLFRILFGPAGQQLGALPEYRAQLPQEVNYELGIIAGNRSIDPISSALIGSENDGKVSIASTRLAGMKDHIVVPASHTFFPGNREVQRQTAYFLAHGMFDRS